MVYWNFFFFCFLESYPQHMEGYGSNRSYSCRLTPQPQQHRIQALTYTTAHGSAGSLTQWARPGIRPISSWILVTFINYWAMMGTPGLLNILSPMLNPTAQGGKKKWLSKYYCSFTIHLVIQELQWRCSMRLMFSCLLTQHPFCSLWLKE